MATYDWPEAFHAAQLDWGIQKAGLQFKGPYNGTTQGLDFVAERWVVGVTLPPRQRASAGAVQAFFNRMAGGVNRVRLWHFGSGTRQAPGTPLGSLRGSPQLSALHARGASALTISGGDGKNLITGSSFDIDSDADGIGNAWSAYSQGSTGTVSYSLSTASPQHGTSSQRVDATAMGTTSSDRAGITRTVTLPTPSSAPMVFSAYVRATVNVQVLLLCSPRAGGVVVQTVSQFTSVAPTAPGWQRVSVPFVPVTTIDQVTLHVWLQSATSVSAKSLSVDAAQLEFGTVATDYEPSGGSVMAGDMLGAGGHLFQAAEDAYASSNGILTVPLVNRVRSTIASGSAVTWDKPTAEFIVPASQMRHLFTPGGVLQGGQFDLEEVW